MSDGKKKCNEEEKCRNAKKMQDGENLKKIMINWKEKSHTFFCCC